MTLKNKYNAFRGNIEFKKLDLFNYDKKENSSFKNSIFKNFFELLKQNRLKSNYQIREYILIYVKNVTDNIIHCQLARKRNLSKYELKNYKIEELKDLDYPFVNVFIDLESQKFLIELKSAVFDNAETCCKILKNIMDKDLNESNAFIEINAITEEASFWEKIDKYDVYSIEFNLNAPNWLDSSNSAVDLMKQIRQDTGADKTKITLSKKDKNPLEINKDRIQPFVEYSTAGAGSWKMRYKNKETGQSTWFKSDESGNLIALEIDENVLNDILEEKQIEIIVDAFNKVEKIEKFKKVNNE